MLVFFIKFDRLNKNSFNDNIKSPLLGKTIPELNLIKIDKNKIINFKKYKDKQFAVNFFASWCQPCKIEAPILDKISYYIDIIGISYKDSEKDMKDFLKSYGNPYTEIGIDKTGSIAIEWGVYGVPETFLINNGKIIYKHTGPITHSDLHDNILPLIKK